MVRVHVDAEEEQFALNAPRERAEEIHVQPRVIGIGEAVERVAFVGPLLPARFAVVHHEVLFLRVHVRVGARINVRVVHELQAEQLPVQRAVRLVRLQHQAAAVAVGPPLARHVDIPRSIRSYADQPVESLRADLAFHAGENAALHAERGDLPACRRVKYPDLLVGAVVGDEQ